MLVYRIGKTQYADDLSGTGSKLFGGRWNHINIPCIYTSESRALAILEYSVNVEVVLIPKNLSMAVFEIEEKDIYEIGTQDLHPDWKDIPTPLSSKELGSKLLLQNISIIKVPSVVVEQEYNYILHPSAHHQSFRLVDIQSFAYDVRIKGG
ncbi:RES family NAD+ phosphorylase [Sphingobacterium wenxiniae]|uniref:RES domain-containing protein n=1 Tax=Sphingobacterium wenxiniae TaxID=683125 RepID=A0A1I6QQB6_9SPHI|nr:RES family NAD+ phosphorylase [Sphingobacterium wenxiniae]SFS54508.1 RES domain-containing protein [Sphingobacterium wenxiniae]